MSWQHTLSWWEDGGPLEEAGMWKKWPVRGHGGGASSDPAKGHVKGHTSPAGAGEHPGGLMLACETKGESPEVSAACGCSTLPGKQELPSYKG